MTHHNQTNKLTTWFLSLNFNSRSFLWFYPYYLSCVENRVCLSHGVQVIDAIWWAMIRIVAGVGDLVQRIEDGQAQVGYLVVGRSRGRVTLCAICTMHNETRSASFLVWPPNHGRRFLLVWPQNQWLQVYRFGPQN
jgi:hypothetical protein